MRRRCRQQQQSSRDGSSVILYCGSARMSAGGGAGGVAGPGFQRNTFLRRSDSYRRARTVMAPDVVTHNNRKSVEVVSINNNHSTNSSQLHTKITSPPTNGTTNGLGPGHPPAAVKSDKHQPQQPGKNNFLRSLRSSFSFSSLRVKTRGSRPSLHGLTISAPLEATRAAAEARLQVSGSAALLYIFNPGFSGLVVAPPNDPRTQLMICNERRNVILTQTTTLHPAAASTVSGAGCWKTIYQWPRWSVELLNQLIYDEAINNTSFEYYSSVFIARRPSPRPRRS